MFDKEVERDLSRHQETVLPGVVFEAEPGPELAAFLSVIDPKELSGNDQVMVLQAHQRLVSHFQAKVYADIAALTNVMFEFDQDWELAHEATAMELRAALRLTRRSAAIEVGFAQELVNRLPRVAAEMEAGRVDVRRARVLIDETIHLSETQARQVVDETIDRAGELTTGELRARVRKLCFAIEPDQAALRYKTALDERKLVNEPTLEGTANIYLTNIAPDKASAALDRINHIAKSLCSPTETRTMDQLRTDVALDLLCGRTDHKTTGRGTVNIHADLKTLVELAEAPGELAGFGPVVADIARQVTEQQQHSEWRFRITDPETGLPVHLGTTRRRPNTEQRRHVELRDLTCVFPGCRMSATDCDIDHINPWARTGQTNIDRLAPGCRHDHVRRHKYDWTYRPLPGGDYLWTSRLGHTYTTSGRPPPKPG